MSGIDDNKCPMCGNDMTLVKRFYLCTECGYSISVEKEDRKSKNKLYASRYIFISYGHDSFASLAIRLKDDLKKRGHLVWTDLELKTGDDWEFKIEKALDNTISQKPNGCFLLLMSPYSVRRPDGYCLNELSKALKSGVFTIPVKIVGTVEPPLSIARIQFLDMSECFAPDFCESFYQRQLQLLIKAIENDEIDFDGMQARLQKFLKPIEFKSEISKHMKSFTGRQWILTHIQEWLANPNGSKVFWLTGGPGVGKTAISIWLSCRVLPEIHAWHLCQHSDSITSDPKKCVLSLAYYLSTHLPDYFEKLKYINLEDIVNINSVNVNTLFMRLLVEPLNAITPSVSPIVILIDAIDEANNENGENSLAKFIGTNFSKFPSWIRIIVTSRPIHEVKKWFKQLNPVVLETSDERNLSDIKLYIRYRLEKLNCIKSNINVIIETILRKSEGVFLYAEFVCDSIELGEIDPNKPDDFPLGLYNVYENYFQRRFPSVDQYRREVAPLLKLIVIAKEPLALCDLLFYLKSLDRNWDEDFLDGIIKQLGSLFRIENDTIVPFHKSIYDWLTHDKDSDYYINRKKGHQGIISWANMYGQNYEIMPKYFFKYLGFHLLQIENIVELQKILTNQYFFEQQIIHLNYDDALSTYFENLRGAFFSPNVNLRNVYESSFFYQLLNRNRRYFLDNGYFLDLQQLGFQEVVENLLAKCTLDDSNYVGILYYLYALEDFDGVICLSEKIMRCENLFQNLDAVTKSQVYEVYGLSLRKLGTFKDAEYAFIETSEWGRRADDSYQTSLGYANLAKIYYHQLDFKLGYEYNNLAFSFLSKSLEEDNTYHGSKTGIRLFMAEFKRLAAECYIWGYDYNKAKECLDYIEQVYSEIQIRDRYYVRYLYTSALYSICVHDVEYALELLEKAEGLCRNNYDRATVLYYEALLIFVYGNSFSVRQINNRIDIAITLFKNIHSNIELTEVCMLSALFSVEKETVIEYNLENYKWFEYVFDYFKKLKNDKNESENSWKWRLDTDCTKKYLFVSFGK